MNIFEKLRTHLQIGSQHNANIFNIFVSIEQSKCYIQYSQASARWKHEEFLEKSKYCKNIKSKECDR